MTPSFNDKKYDTTSFNDKRLFSYDHKEMWILMWLVE